MNELLAKSAESLVACLIGFAGGDDSVDVAESDAAAGTVDEVLFFLASYK